MHCFWWNEPKKTQQLISTFASLSWNRSQWSLQCHGVNFREVLPDLYILMVSKWPTLILPEVVCSSHTCFSIYAHHNFPSISFTTILHNRKKVKDYHNGQTQAQKQKKLPTVSAKSVMKQEAGMSDVKILAGKWKIGVNTAGASKMSCKPISDSFGKRTYHLGGKLLPRQSEQNTKFVHSTADLESK